MLLSLDEAKAYQPTGVKTSLGKPKKAQSRPLVDTPLPKTKRLYIRLQTHHTDDVLRDIKVILEQHPGNTETVLVVGDKKRPIRLSQKIKYSEGFHEALANVVGDDAVKLH